jgi:hypothetical protein
MAVRGPPLSRRETIVQSCRDLVDRKGACSGSGRSEREWDPVQPSEDLSQRGRLSACQVQVGPGGPCPLCKQSDSFGLTQRWHAPGRLTNATEWLAAGRQDAQLGRGPQQRVSQVRGRVDDVLAIVEDQEQGLAAQEFDKSLGQRVAWHFPQPEPVGDGVHDVRGVDQCGELDEPRAIGVLADEAGALQREVVSRLQGHVK